MIEKWIYALLYQQSNAALCKTIGDKYFQNKAVKVLVAEYNKNNPNPKHKEKSFMNIS